MTKISKGRYSFTVGTHEFIVFRDCYTGLWRVRQKDGPVDWAGPFKTKKEAIEYVRDEVTE